MDKPLPSCIFSLEELKSKGSAPRNGWQNRTALAPEERNEYMDMMRKGRPYSQIRELYESRHNKKLAPSTIHNWRVKIRNEEIRERTDRRRALESGNITGSPVRKRMTAEEYEPEYIVPIEFPPEESEETPGILTQQERQKVSVNRRNSIAEDYRYSSLQPSEDLIRKRSASSVTRKDQFPRMGDMNTSSHRTSGLHSGRNKKNGLDLGQSGGLLFTPPRKPTVPVIKIDLTGIEIHQERPKVAANRRNSIAEDYRYLSLQPPEDLIRRRSASTSTRKDHFPRLETINESLHRPNTLNSKENGLNIGQSGGLLLAQPPRQSAPENKSFEIENVGYQAEGPSSESTREDIQQFSNNQQTNEVQYIQDDTNQEVGQNNYSEEAGPSRLPEEAPEEVQESGDDQEADSSCRLDNTLMIKAAVIGDNDKDKKKRRRELMDYDDRQRTIKLINNFSEEQINRYEMYRRSCFQKNQIKRLMTMTTPCTVHQHVSIAVAGIAKVFVGELVEEALKVADNQNYKGPLLPSHIRESVRRLGHVPGSHLHDKKRKKARLF